MPLARIVKKKVLAYTAPFIYSDVIEVRPSAYVPPYIWSRCLESAINPYAVFNLRPNYGQQNKTREHAA